MDATALDHAAFVERIETIRADMQSAVEDIFQVAFAGPVLERYAAATALMQAIVEDLGAIRELVDQPPAGPRLRVLEGGRAFTRNRTSASG